ncbi:hypothetical protein PILCRDRAFT_4159 [Piloderma croceum F 1598]|uniref:Uncharacterized protein n=1 Tax=Piloderma croceum (strain F 1598) TaxID=765440 RepID=A0A0C3G8C3_PILCF|nr:hypothetical protein PILCRDRAFT_4159 [Piloderma croceum F 1598]
MVLKHEAPYSMSRPGLIAFRGGSYCQNFGITAMNSVSILPGDVVATVPTIHYFDDVAHVVIMDDCGAGVLTLKQLMIENPP